MAEKKVIELEVKTNAQSLKAQLRDAQNEVNALSEKFGATSEQAINAAKNAARLKDAIGDAKALTDAFNPDAKFNALSSSIGGVVNGFQAYEGALGLVGVESAQLQEQLLKVQSAMALSQGLQGLGEARDSFKQLGPILKGIAAGLVTASGLAMVNNIRKQEFRSGSNITMPSTSPGDIGGGNQNQVITPNFNIIGNQNQTQLAQLNQAPIKAYVVGSDVTTQQMLDKKKIQNATL